MAWLHSSAPLPEKSKAKPVRRIRTLKDDHPALTSMPDVSNCTDIVKAFNMSGYVASVGMDATPLPWRELTAMNEGAGLHLTTWALSMVRKMSERYCNMYSLASDNNMPPPHVDDYDAYKTYSLAESERQLMESRKARINKPT